MGTTALTRLNLKLEKTKLDRLRRQLRARSNSEAVCKRPLTRRWRVLCHIGRSSVARTALKRQNFMVEPDKVRQLRRVLRARSDSEAVRLAIERQLAVKEALAALRRLRDRGTLEDVFGRLRSDRK